MSDYWSKAYNLVGGPKRFFIAQVCEKYTKNAIGKSYTITTSGGEVGLPKELEKAGSVKVDGRSNYVDFTELEDEITHWQWVVDCRAYSIIQMKIEEWLNSGEFGELDNKVFKALLEMKKLDEVYLVCYIILGNNAKAYELAQCLEKSHKDNDIFNIS